MPLCRFTSFFSNDPPTTQIYTLSLHDALPISSASEWPFHGHLEIRRLKRRSVPAGRAGRIRNAPVGRYVDGAVSFGWTSQEPSRVLSALSRKPASVLLPLPEESLAEWPRAYRFRWPKFDQTSVSRPILQIRPVALVPFVIHHSDKWRRCQMTAAGCAG